MASAMNGVDSRVTALLDRWATDMHLDAVEAAAWHDAGRLHDALRDAPEADLRAVVPDPALPCGVLHGPAAAVRLAADGERRHGYAAWHLHDGEQRVHALQIA